MICDINTSLVIESISSGRCCWNIRMSVTEQSYFAFNWPYVRSFFATGESGRSCAYPLGRSTVNRSCGITTSLRAETIIVGPRQTI